MKKISLLIKTILIGLAAVFTFFNVIAAVAFLNMGYFKIGTELLLLTVLGYDLAVLLVWLKKEISAGVLSVAATITLLLLKDDFINYSRASIRLYNRRQLPMAIIGGVVLIYSIVKLVNVIKEARRKKALENRKKSPSIFS